jgi:AcrR family transcriptional regulator
MPQKESVLRRPPKQERSRERVDEILGAAKRLIGEKGIDAVKMREIAALTGGPISSIYQYFPNKSAIIATLYNQWSSEIMEVLQQALANVLDLDELFAATAALLDFYYERIKSDPAILDLINAIQADKALQNIDLAETRRQTDCFCTVARQWIPESRFEAFRRVTFMMFQLANGAVRLALSAGPPEADAILADYKLIIQVQLNDFAGDRPAVA